MKKKSLEEYKESNEILKQLNEERLKRKKQSKPEQSDQNSDLIFSDGRSIYLTPINFISPPPPNTITLRQLLYEDLQNLPNRVKTITSCIMTTFCLENSFISPIISQNFPFCLVIHDKSSYLERPSPNFTIISPEIQDRFGSFHAKIFLIKFPSRLRVVVTSANLIEADWSLIGQLLWFQDFYPSSTASSCSFQRSLKDFFDAVLPKTYSLKKELNIDLDVFDFSSSSVELVFSIPGRFPSTRGLGLGRIRDLRGPKQYLKVLYQCSSIGSYNQKSFDDFLRMVTGNQQAEAQIVFPSIKNVRESVLGCEGAGVFFIKKEKFEAKGFPKEKFCRFEGPSGVEQLRGHLSHSKVMILTGEEEGDDDLVYIGSHNLSAAAWGVLEKKESQIYIKNFEIGVAFVPKEGSAALKKRLMGLMPFKVEPSRYDETDRPFYIDSDLNE